MKFKVVGISFDHMHMGDLLRMVHTHPRAEIAGICDAQPERMRDAIRNFGIPQSLVFKDIDSCLEKTRPDFAIICSSPARHARHVEQVAEHKVHILVEKPFANSLRDADRMLAAARANRVMLAINWPLRWQPGHATAYRLVQAGKIGELQEVHYYNGNRGPLFHAADKIEATPTAAQKRTSWFYNRDLGGGSMLDYLGYGTTLGTWFLDGRKPIDVTSVVDRPRNLDVDEHSITVARYSFGLSKFETRWGTFTDPWKFQPQPKCGFVLKGSDGTISSYDYEQTVRIQTRKDPEGEDLAVDVLKPPYENPIQYFIECLRKQQAPEGPLDPALSRIGQQIVDSAVLSAGLEKTITLLK